MLNDYAIGRWGADTYSGPQLLTGDELRDLVKGYLAKLASEGTPMPPPALHADRSSDEEEAGSSVGWQKAMRWCPRELHELVNSKACRGETSLRLPSVVVLDS